MGLISYMKNPARSEPLIPLDPLDAIVRDRIAQLILQTGITQTDLGQRIGRTQPWVSRYLKAEFDANLETLNRIAMVFGLTLGQLVGLRADPAEATLLDLYRNLPPSTRASLIDVVREMSARARRGRRSRP